MSNQGGGGRRVHAREVGTEQARTHARAYRFASTVLSVLLAHSCGDAGTPTSPSLQPLPVAAETLSFRYHYSAGDSVT
jgi:hypothetical protein